MAQGLRDEEIIQPRVMPEDLPRKITPRAWGESFGGAVTQFADTLERQYQADSATWAGNQLSKFRQQAIQSLDAAKQKASTGDPDGFYSDYMAGFDKAATQFTGNREIQGNPYASKMINNGISELRDTLQTHTLSWQAQQAVAYRTASFDDNLKSQAALVEAHPELVGQIGSTLKDQANAIGGDPSSRLVKMRTMDDTLTLAAANGLTRQDPRGTLQALNDPDKAPDEMKGVIGRLTDAQREAVRAKANEHLGDNVYTALQRKDFVGAQLALSKNQDLLDPRTGEQLQRTINSQVELAHSMDEKGQRDASNGLLKNAILMSQQGQLTPQWIEKYHNTWEPAAYEYAYKLLSGKETQTDPHTYAPLLSDALSGKDVTPQAQEALYGNKLTLSDYRGLVEKGESPRKGYVSRGSDFISESLRPNPMVTDPAGQRSYANALDDWRQWTNDHPAASENEARTAYRGIADHYQIITADKATAFMPVPLHLVGSRMQPDLGSTWNATKAAHDAGTLSDAEFQRQATLIQQWMQLQSKKAANQAVTK